MVKELLEQQVFMYVIFVLGGFGILAKLLLLPVYKSLVKASFHMPDTGNRLFKLMRLKFQACYELKISVHDVRSFVDKYFINHKFCGIFLHTWRKFSSQMAFLCMCIGAAAAVLGIMEECSLRMILEHAGTGFLFLAFLYVLDGLCAFDFKQEQMKINAVDFFDNFLKSRMEAQYLHQEEGVRQETEAEKEAREEAAASSPETDLTEEPLAANPQPVPARRKRKPEMYLTSEEEKEKIIEDILKEYLV